jgi:dynein heavy chain
MPDHNQIFFVLINYQEVKQQAFDKVSEWLNVLGDTLIDMSTKDLNVIVKDILEYEKHLKTEVHGIDGLKHVLNIISEIKNTSMEMELRINESVEQFRVLRMQKYEVKPEVQHQVDILAQQWVDLIEMADRKDFELNEFKRNFSEVTKGEVSKFKKDLQEAYEKYLHSGPGSDNITLEEGVVKLEESKELNEMFNRKREEYVLAEKLFNLPISKYPELIKMEQDNIMYEEIYSIFKSHQANVKEWSMMAWSKLDVTQLTSGTEEKEKKVRKLQNKLPNPDHIAPFVKLRNTIVGFKDSLPLIQQLKIPAIQERHWKKIMEETGKDLGEINFKTMTLSKVFELELQNYEEQVMAIC